MDAVQGVPPLDPAAPHGLWWRCTMPRAVVRQVRCHTGLAPLLTPDRLFLGATGQISGPNAGGGSSRFRVSAAQSWASGTTDPARPVPASCYCSMWVTESSTPLCCAT